MIIILIFSCGIQSVNAFNSPWKLIFKNDQEKTIPLSAISPQGYHFSVATGNQERKIVIPHNKVKSASPLKEILVTIYLDSQRSNQAYLLGLEDSTVYLAGQTEDNKWRTLSLSASNIWRMEYQNKSIDLSQAWRTELELSQLKFSQESPLLTKQATTRVTKKVTKKPLNNPASEQAPKPTNSLYLESETEDAFIYLNGLPTIVSSPYTFKSLTPGTYPYELRWQVNDNLWSAHGTTTLRPDTQKKVFLKSERHRPELTIQTIPSDAVIKIDNTSELDFERHWTSPLQLKDLQPGIRKFTLIKPGYRDTTLFVNVMASEPTLVVVDLQRDLTIDNEIFHKRLAQKRLGATLFWSSIPTAALGFVYHALAEQRLKEAWETKAQLRQYGLHTENSPNYIRVKSANREAVEEANSHYDNSRILLGIATILSVSGVVLYF